MDGSTLFLARVAAMSTTEMPTDLPTEEPDNDRYLPARMINECAYCPRLFYLMHVEGQFAPNAETVEGDHVHRQVDRFISIHRGCTSVANRSC